MTDDTAEQNRGAHSWIPTAQPQRHARMASRTVPAVRGDPGTNCAMTYVTGRKAFWVCRCVLYVYGYRVTLRFTGVHTTGRTHSNEFPVTLRTGDEQRAKSHVKNTLPHFGVSLSE